MTYLDCSAYDCCHNKGGACCLGCIDVQHTGENGAVCGSYCSNEGYANAATDNAPRHRRDRHPLRRRGLPPFQADDLPRQPRAHRREHHRPRLPDPQRGQMTPAAARPAAAPPGDRPAASGAAARRRVHIKFAIGKLKCEPTVGNRQGRKAPAGLLPRPCRPGADRGRFCGKSSISDGRSCYTFAGGRVIIVSAFGALYFYMDREVFDIWHPFFCR